MKMPIFIFTDDLDIFRSLKTAESCLESWMVEQKIEGFDAEGRVLAASVELRRVKRFFGLVPVTLETVVISETEEMASEKLHSLLEQYLERLTGNSIGSSKLTYQELADHVIKLRGYTD